MTEVCLQIGEHGRLAGILTEAAAPRPRAGCILVNAGLVPKLGPYRLYVELARRLAQDGIATLRFDLGGVGDSRPDRADRPLQERTISEIRAAAGELRRRYPDLSGLVVGGVCSGAEDAFRYAEQDASISGVLLIDPFSYRTAGWKWRHLAYRATRRALRTAGIYEPVLAPRVTASTAVSGTPSRVVKYRYMEHAESSRILKTMIARRTKVHFIYTGSQQGSFNHAGQLQRMFEGIDFQGRVTVDYFSQLDHTQLLAEDRRTVVEAIAAWLAPG